MYGSPIDEHLNPEPIDMTFVQCWLEKYELNNGYTDEVSRAFGHVVKEVYDLTELTEAQLANLHQHLVGSDRYASRMGVIVILDAKAVGWRSPPGDG